MYSWLSEFLSQYLTRQSSIFHVPSTFRIQTAAYAKLEEIREETAVNIRRLIEDHKYVDVRIHIMPTYILIPDYGIARRLSDNYSQFTSFLLSIVSFK